MPNKIISLDPLRLGTLNNLLKQRVEHQWERVIYQFQDFHTHSSMQTLSLGELWTGATTIASYLQQHIKPDDRVVILLPQGLDFIKAFLGCLLAGAIAVPAYPPQPGRIDRTLNRISSIINDCHPKAFISSQQLVDRISEADPSSIPDMGTAIWLGIDSLNPSFADSYRPTARNGGDLAFLQYTSGSTGAPKGVMVSHANILYNSDVISRNFKTTEQTRSISWLPAFHDMGLIGGLLQPLYAGFPVLLMSPMSFLQRPIRWLQAIGDFSANLTGGPNFAYDLCVQRIKQEQREQLDLSHWNLAFTGAEPIRAQTLEAFAQAFSTSGFSKKAFLPCYGLAETTLMVCCARIGKGPIYESSNSVNQPRGRIELNPPVVGDGLEHTLVSSGWLGIDNAVAIVHPEKHSRLPDGQIGEIWVSGASVTQGYWQKPQETEKSFLNKLKGTDVGPFFRTGDLGFIKRGELFITGRLKDVINVFGRNYYPQDIEQVVEEAHPAIRPNGVAAFSFRERGREQLVVVTEFDKRWLDRFANQENHDFELKASVQTNSQAIIKSIRQAVVNILDIHVYDVVLIKVATIPRTTSGKIRRSKCKEYYEQGRLAILSHARGGAKWLDKEDNINVKNHLFMPEEKLAGTNLAHATSLSACLAWLREYGQYQIDSALIDHEGDIPFRIISDIGKRGLLGLNIPKHFQGPHISFVDTIAVMQQLGAIDTSLGLFVAMANGFGVRPLLRFGGGDLCEDLLPKIATGDYLAAFALNEPHTGSQWQAFSTQAVEVSEHHWQISGTKVWSGPSTYQGVMHTFVPTFDTRGKPIGINGFTVDFGAKQLTTFAESLTLGTRGLMQNTTTFNKVPVTRYNLLGQLDQGPKVIEDAQLMTYFYIGAVCLGSMRRCLQLLYRYTIVRTVAGRALAKNPSVVYMFSQHTAAINAFSLCLKRLGEEMDSSPKSVPSVATMVCKIIGPELAYKIVDDCMQCMGPRGFIEANAIPQWLRDIRGLRLFPITTEALTVRLGKYVTKHTEKVLHFMSFHLGAEQEIACFREDIIKLKRLLPFDTWEDNYRHQLLLGEIASWSLFCASLNKEANSLKRYEFERAQLWAKNQLVRIRNKIFDNAGNEIVLNDEKYLDSIFEDYKQLIGDFDGPAFDNVAQYPHNKSLK